MASESSDNLIIRPMLPDDLAAVYAIDQASFTAPWSLSGYQYELYENPNAYLWVAEMQRDDDDMREKLVGALVVWYVVDEVHIATIAIEPAFRRRGIGRALLAHGLRELAVRDARSATLEVRESNAAAIKLYESFTFAIAGYRPRYYRDNLEGAYIMNLENLDQLFDTASGKMRTDYRLPDSP